MSHCLKMFSYKKLINSLHKMLTMSIEKYYEISNQWVFDALENIVALSELMEIVCFFHHISLSKITKNL